MEKHNQHIWYDDWFNSPYYNILYDNRNEQEASSFVKAIVNKGILPSKASILDLACGNGRFAYPLYKKGFKVTGIDIARHSIENAKEKYKHTSIQFIIHNMLQPFPVNNFDVLCNFYTSFGYFNKKSMLQVLKNIYQALKPQGHMLIDYMNCARTKKNIIAEDKIIKHNLSFYITREVIDTYITKTIKVHKEGREYVFQEKVYDLNLEDFKQLFYKSGFKILHSYGNYMMQAFSDATSDRLILYAQKYRQ